MSSKNRKIFKNDLKNSEQLEKAENLEKLNTKLQTKNIL